MDDDALDLLLAGVKDTQQRKEITTAFYSFASGDPNTFAVQFAVLLKAHASSLKLLPTRVHKALATETNGIRDALLAHQAFLQKHGHAAAPTPTNDMGREALEALVSVQKNIEAQLAAHSELLRTERQAIATRITTADRLFKRLAAHRIVLGLLISYAAGLLSIPAFHLLLSFLSRVPR
jgi:hypothetical protein